MDKKMYITANPQKLKACIKFLSNLVKKQREEIVGLRKKLKSMGRDLAHARKNGREGPMEDDGRPWFDPSADTLAKFAEDCRVRFDLPPIMGPHAGKARAIVTQASIIS